MTTIETVPAAGSPRRPRAPRAPRWRVATLAGATLVLVGGAAIAMAASPEPSTAPNPDATTQPDGTTDGGRLFRPLLRGLGLGDGFAGVAGRHGGFAAGNITITAINGSSVSLETVDGWTRTITVTDQTTITKEGEEIALADLQVGDKIRFRQTVDDAGNYTVTAIAVVLPSVIGQATAVDGDSITLSQPDGTSVTVHVDSSTNVHGRRRDRQVRGGRRGRHDRRRERRGERRWVAERIAGPRRHDLGRSGSRAGARPRTGEVAHPRRRGPVRGARELLEQRELIPPITEHSRRRVLLPSTSCALGGAPTPGPSTGSGRFGARCCAPGLAAGQVLAKYSPPH